MSPWTLAYWWGGGVFFLFDTSDLQMLLKWHDFPVYFLIFFVSYTFLCVCWKIRNSQIYSRAKNMLI